MNQVRGPSRGTRQGSMLWSLWPYCTSTSSTTVCSFREEKEDIFLILHAAGEFAWALPHSFISISWSCSVPHPPPHAPHPTRQRLLAGRSFTPSAKFDSARVETLPGSCPHVPAGVAWEVQTKWLCQRKTEVPYLYLASVGTFPVSDHEMCD